MSLASMLFTFHAGVVKRSRATGTGTKSVDTLCREPETSGITRLTSTSHCSWRQRPLPSRSHAISPGITLDSWIARSRSTKTTRSAYWHVGHTTVMPARASRTTEMSGRLEETKGGEILAPESRFLLRPVAEEQLRRLAPALGPHRDVLGVCDDDPRRAARRSARPRAAEADHAEKKTAQSSRAAFEEGHARSPSNGRATAARVRQTSFESTRLKVGDRDGNPIEIASIIVMRVKDTARRELEGRVGIGEIQPERKPCARAAVSYALRR